MYRLHANFKLVVKLLQRASRYCVFISFLQMFILNKTNFNVIWIQP